MGSTGEQMRTLIFPVTSLDLLVDVFLHVPLEDACPGRLVEAGGLQNVRRIDPIILSAAHHMFLKVRTKLVFVDGDLQT